MRGLEVGVFFEGRMVGESWRVGIEKVLSILYSMEKNYNVLSNVLPAVVFLFMIQVFNYKNRCNSEKNMHHLFLIPYICKTFRILRNKMNFI